MTKTLEDYAKDFKACLNKFFSLPPEMFFLVVGAPITLILLFTTPPFQFPDEFTHFYKEVYLSQGHIMAYKLPSLVGADLPIKYSETEGHYSYMYLDETKKLKTNLLFKDLQYPEKDNRLVPTHFENTAAYPPAAYTAQSFAIFITNLITGSVVVQLYVARLASAICWLILIFCAIRLLPIGRWSAVALSLTPLSLVVSASCSNDAITFGLSLLFISQALRAITRTNKITRLEIAAIAINCLLLGLCKPPYFLLIGLVFAIPSVRFQSLKQRMLIMMLFILPAFLSTALWQLAISHVLINVYPGSDTHLQLHYVLAQPLSVLENILHTFLFSPTGDNLILQFVGLNAWFNIHTPFWMILLDYLVIFILVLHEPATTQRVRINKTFRLFCIGICLAGSLTIGLLLYLTFTPVGLDTVIGLNSRYFIPFAYLLIPILNASSLYSRKSHTFIILKFLIVFISLLTIPLIITRFY
ncbi:MAG: hypothetical protein JWN01_85 [Patescibacteria group bacterium]|nr:hypothetical protein [Patescibacteria group bacterium]